MINLALARRLAAEGLGTGLLLIAVVGSGIAAEGLSPGDVGLQLFENAAATAAALIAIILALGPVSGAHLNPVVTLADRAYGALTNVEAAAYVVAQFLGAAFGVVVANLMFSLPAIELSTRTRSSGGLWLGEVVATFGLLLVIFGVVRSGRAAMAPLAVGAYIGGAYFFTASTSFANPAVTAARTLSDTFAGIAPGSVLAFIAAQLVGGALAVGTIRFLYPAIARSAGDVVLPHAAVEGSESATNGAEATTASAREEALEGLTESERDAVRSIADHLTLDFSGVFSTGTIERFVAESFSSLARAAAVPNYVPLLTERFARDRLRALAQVQGVTVSDVPEVLFVCVHNAGRSQMAAALLDHHAQGRVHVRSAGSAPANVVNPAVVEAMKEWGIDISKEFPKPLTDEVARAADVLVTMGCGDACPVYPGKRYLDWELVDPAGQGVEAVRPIRDEIDRRVRALLEELVPSATSS